MGLPAASHYKMFVILFMVTIVVCGAFIIAKVYASNQVISSNIPVEGYASVTQEINNSFDALRKQVLKKTVSDDKLAINKEKYLAFRLQLQALEYAYDQLISESN